MLRKLLINPGTAGNFSDIAVKLDSKVYNTVNVIICKSRHVINLTTIFIPMMINCNNLLRWGEKTGAVPHRKSAVK